MNEDFQQWTVSVVMGHAVSQEIEAFGDEDELIADSEPPPSDVGDDGLGLPGSVTFPGSRKVRKFRWRTPSIWGGHSKRSQSPSTPVAAVVTAELGNMHNRSEMSPYLDWLPFARAASSASSIEGAGSFTRAASANSNGGAGAFTRAASAGSTGGAGAFTRAASAGSTGGAGAFTRAASGGSTGGAGAFTRAASGGSTGGAGAFTRAASGGSTGGAGAFTRAASGGSTGGAGAFTRAASAASSSAGSILGRSVSVAIRHITSGVAEGLRKLKNLGFGRQSMTESVKVRGGGDASIATPSLWLRSAVAAECAIFGRGKARVEVYSAPVKTVHRMREKVKEYSCSADSTWPHCANILDPVRASVVCSGPAEILEVFNWFTGKFAVREDGTAPSHVGNVLMPVCRVKNKFALAKEELIGG